MNKHTYAHIFMHMLIQTYTYISSGGRGETSGVAGNYRRGASGVDGPGEQGKRQRERVFRKPPDKGILIHICMLIYSCIHKLIHKPIPTLIHTLVHKYKYMHTHKRICARTLRFSPTGASAALTSSTRCRTRPVPFCTRPWSSRPFPSPRRASFAR